MNSLEFSFRERAGRKTSCHWVLKRKHGTRGNLILLLFLNLIQSIARSENSHHLSPYGVQFLSVFSVHLAGFSIASRNNVHLIESDSSLF